MYLIINKSLQHPSCTFSRHWIFFLKPHISEPYNIIVFTILLKSNDTGYSCIWSQQFFQNTYILLALIRNRLNDQFTQEWHFLIKSSPTAINYRLCKDKFEFENYFNILENKDIY
jgi:hypothetical protein